MHVAIIAVIALLCSVSADKIYGIAYPGGHSHQLILAKIGRELVSRGHEFFYIHSTVDAHNTNNLTGLHVLTYQAPVSFEELTAVGPQIVEMSPTDGVKLIYHMQQDYCKNLMKSKDVLDQVRDARAIVADCTYLCTTMVADYLNTPVRVDFSATGINDPLFTVPYGIASPVSYHPMMGSGLGRPKNLSDRLKNVIFYYVDTQIIMGTVALPWADELRLNYGINKTHLESQANTGILLAQSTWGLEFPHPITPAVKLVGPILPSPGKPLPADLESFISNGGNDGFILVSMGTILHLSDNLIKKLTAALIALPYKIIWKLNMDVGELPSNIYVSPWIPQNDLLAHPSIKLFITHGGLNGVQEAAYHGVPVVGFPLFGDQFENLIRVRDRGFGIILERDEFSAETLTIAVNSVFTDKSFATNAARIKKIVRDQPESTPECANWIEYALRHDGALHLVVPFDLPWWQQSNLDVYVVLLAVFYLIVLGIRKVFSLICCGKTKVKVT